MLDLIVSLPFTLHIFFTYFSASLLPELSPEVIRFPPSRPRLAFRGQARGCRSADRRRCRPGQRGSRWCALYFSVLLFETERHLGVHHYSALFRDAFLLGFTTLSPPPNGPQESYIFFFMCSTGPETGDIPEYFLVPGVYWLLQTPI